MDVYHAPIWCQIVIHQYHFNPNRLYLFKHLSWSKDLEETVNVANRTLDNVTWTDCKEETTPWFSLSKNRLAVLDVKSQLHVPPAFEPGSCIAVVPLQSKGYTETPNKIMIVCDVTISFWRQMQWNMLTELVWCSYYILRRNGCLPCTDLVSDCDSSVSFQPKQIIPFQAPFLVKGPGRDCKCC